MFESVKERNLPYDKPEIFTTQGPIRVEKGLLFAKPSLTMARLSAASHKPHLSNKELVSKELIAVLRLQIEEVEEELRLL